MPEPRVRTNDNEDTADWRLIKVVDGLVFGEASPELRFNQDAQLTGVVGRGEIGAPLVLARILSRERQVVGESDPIAPDG